MAESIVVICPTTQAEFFPTGLDSSDRIEKAREISF